VAEAIAVFFDEHADGEVRALWGALADAGLPSLLTLAEGPYPPHVSLVGAESFDGVDWDAVRSAVKVGPPVVHLDGLGTFPGDEGVLFLRVRPAPELIRLQADVYRAVVDQQVPLGAHYVPGRWQPHCTLAMGMRDVAQHAAAADVLKGRTTVTASVRAVAVGDPSGDRWILRSGE
jgi:hypothetical protein